MRAEGVGVNPGLALADAQHVLQQQAFSRLLGARLTDFGGGAATLEIDVCDDLLQQNGFVHGGVLSYAADNALTFAGGTVLGASVLTGGFTINYLRPAVGTSLVARAHVVHAGKRQAVCACELSMVGDDGELSLCAVAQGTIRAVGGQAA